MMSVKLLTYKEHYLMLKKNYSCDNYENANKAHLTRNSGGHDLICLVIFLEKLKVDVSGPCRLFLVYMELAQNQRMIIVKSATRSIMENLSTKCVILRLLTCVSLEKFTSKKKK